MSAACLGARLTSSLIRSIYCGKVRQSGLMLRVFACISSAHDWRLLALAAAVCLFSGVASIHLLERARPAGRLRAFRLVAAAAAAAFGLWLTHFISILAYRPGLEMAFDLPLTALSLVVAAAIFWCGFGLFVYRRSRRAAALGGAAIGGGASAMHYIGMAALQGPADPSWIASYVVASIGSSVILAALAMTVARRRGVAAGLSAGALLSLAILALHFVAMAGLILVPDPAREPDPFAVAPTSLALVVSSAAVLALGVALTAAIYDRRMTRRAAEFEEQRKALARRAQEQLRERNAQLDSALNNMSQALCMFDADQRLIVCNARYARIFNLPPELTARGTPVLDILKYRVAQGMYPGDDGEAHIRSRLEVAERNVA